MMHDPIRHRLTHSADDPGFRYTGRWRPGCPATTINSGAVLDFVFPGAACELAFDVAGMTQFPAMMIQTDDGPLVRHRLDAVNTTIQLCPEHLPATARGHAGYWHRVRCWTIIASADPGQWVTQNGGCKFLGVRCESAHAVLPPLPAAAATIEFLGDSITASLRLLYAGHDGWDDRDPQTGLIREWHSSQDHQHPVLNWPWQAARLLGLHPIITGFGGQGLTTAGTVGAPRAEDAFPYVHAGAPWRPPLPPRLVVVYQGSNDQAITGRQYRGYLQIIRGAYPHAGIFAICPHPRPAFASIIRDAAQAAGDRIWFLDYSAGVIAPADTSDGCHLNPSGALHLAVRLANDITRLLPYPEE